MSPAPKEVEADLQARERWVASLAVEGKEELMFELDMLLRGLDRFFNLDNMFLNEREQVVQRNFTDELAIVDQLLQRLVGIAQKLLEQSDKNAHLFQRYVESELADDFLRDLMLSKSLAQETPRESLYLIFETLGHMRTVVKALLVRERVAYPVFRAVGELLRRELLQNRFFNPIRRSHFSPIYDRIQNATITGIVTRVGHRTVQKRLSFVFLSLFRLLHYLKFIDPKSREMGYLKSSLLIFSLVRSEARALIPYLEHGFRDRLFDTEGYLVPDESMEIVTAELSDQAVQLVSELDTLAYQMEMELRKVSAEELANASQLTKTFQLRGVVENAHGILTNMFQQAIVNLARAFEPGISGRQIFPHFLSRRQQSKRLFEDISAFRGIMDHFEEQLETRADLDPVAIATSYLLALKRFLDYFKNHSMLLLRFNDLTLFGEFFKMVHLLTPADLEKADSREHFIARSKYFKIFLDTTIGQIQNREDLRGVPVDPERIEKLRDGFLPGGAGAPLPEETDEGEEDEPQRK